MKVNTVSFSSVFQIGDSKEITSFTSGLSLQREREYFAGNEGTFNSPVFYSKPDFLPINESILIIKQNENPVITVGDIEIIGVTTSSIIHIGSSNHIYGDNRLKHIRQLEDRKQEEKMNIQINR